MRQDLEDSPRAAPADASGDADAAMLAELCSRHYDQVFSFAVSFTGDASLAADVTQDVFVKVMKHIEDVRGANDVRSWLFRVAANLCIDDHRRRRRRLVALSDVADDPTFVQPPRQEGHAARRQATAQLRAAVSQLPARLRAPLLLRHVVG
jgi:RNA polymerase sigma-70 factor (ECF subfamily)